jgi:hypothetical protein
VGQQAQLDWRALLGQLEPPVRPAQIQQFPGQQAPLEKLEQLVLAQLELLGRLAIRAGRRVQQGHLAQQGHPV